MLIKFFRIQLGFIFLIYALISAYYLLFFSFVFVFPNILNPLTAMDSGDAYFISEAVWRAKGFTVLAILFLWKQNLSFTHKRAAIHFIVFFFAFGAWYCSKTNFSSGGHHHHSMRFYRGGIFIVNIWKHTASAHIVGSTSLPSPCRDYIFKELHPSSIKIYKNRHYLKFKDQTIILQNVPQNDVFDTPLNSAELTLKQPTSSGKAQQEEFLY